MATLQKAKTERNLGIDLLRCVAMLAIVIIHLINQGGIGSACPVGSAHYYTYQLLLLVCLCAVNVYALISGYVGMTFQPRRWLALWLQVVFLSLVMCLVGEIIDRGSVSKETWLRAVLPVSQWGFWYFSAYTGLYLLLPVLQRGLDALSTRGLYFVIFAVFVGFSCTVSVGFYFRGTDPFALGSGYSPIWLICLYLLGSALRRAQALSRVKTAWLLLTLMASTACLYLGAVFYIRPFCAIHPYSYLNPFQLLNAVCFVELFSRIRCSRGFVRRAVGVLSPLTFGVYLLHVHVTFFGRLKGKMAFVTGKPLPLTLLITLGVALAIYLLASLIDWLRLQLFRLVRVPKLCENTERFLKKQFNRLVGVLTGGKG